MGMCWQMLMCAWVHECDPFSFSGSGSKCCVINFCTLSVLPVKTQKTTAHKCLTWQVFKKIWDDWPLIVKYITVLWVCKWRSGWDFFSLKDLLFILRLVSASIRNPLQYRFLIINTGSLAVSLANLCHLLSLYVVRCGGVCVRVWFCRKWGWYTRQFRVCMLQLSTFFVVVCSTLDFDS